MKKIDTQKNMSARTIGLIIFLVLIGVILIYNYNAKSKKQQYIQSSPSIPVSIGHTILSLDSYNPNTVGINIDSKGDNVTAVQGEISYDPAMITNVHISQGSFLENPIVLFNYVDKKNGRLSYAIAIQPNGESKRGVGTVATISYTLIPGKKGPVALTFSPKTKVTAKGIQQSVLKEATGITLNLP